MTTGDAGTGARDAGRGRRHVPELLAVLRNEHRYAARLLGVLEEQVDALERGEQSDPGMVRDVMDYMTRFPDQYHHPKEDLIFREMLRRDPEVRESVDRLLEDHKRIGREGAELVAVLERASRDRSADTVELQKRARRYASSLYQHMRFEEAAIFERSLSLLEPVDWESVDAEMRSIDDPVFGARVDPEFESLYEHLADRVTRVRTGISALELFHFVAAIESLSAVSEGVVEMATLFADRSRHFRDERKRFARDLRSSHGPQDVFEASRSAARSHRASFEEALHDAGAILTKTRSEAINPYVSWLRELRRQVFRSPDASGSDEPRASS